MLISTATNLKIKTIMKLHFPPENVKWQVALTVVVHAIGVISKLDWLLAFFAARTLAGRIAFGPVSSGVEDLELSAGPGGHFEVTSSIRTLRIGDKLRSYIVRSPAFF